MSSRFQEVPLTAAPKNIRVKWDQKLIKYSKIYLKFFPPFFKNAFKKVTPKYSLLKIILRTKLSKSSLAFCKFFVARGIHTNTAAFSYISVKEESELAERSLTRKNVIY